MGLKLSKAIVMVDTEMHNKGTESETLSLIDE